jgi:hypothetical protein
LREGDEGKREIMRNERRREGENPKSIVLAKTKPWLNQRSKSVGVPMPENGEGGGGVRSIRAEA